MPNLIGLNHIFDDGTICFCLVCKESVTENYPLDRDSAVCQHFRSEDHEKSARNLFKMCVPDPKCDSRNVRFLDIVNNAELEVWEQGKEPSYVSKVDKHFLCLICKEKVSEVCKETDQIIHSLQYHLGSELHVDNVKNCIWWTYHPNLDTNYVALNKIFMYCSFCQNILESKENSLLEFAADHIEAELNKINSVHGSRTELEKITSNDISKTELSETNSDSQTELEETNSNDPSSTLFDPSLMPITYTPGPIIECTQTTKTQSNEISESLESNLLQEAKNVNAAGSVVNLNEVTDEFKSAIININYKGLNMLFLKFFKEEICPECHKEIEVLNDDVPFSMQIHAQQHKNLDLVNDDIELEIQGKANSINCDICHKQIEVFNNKDSVFSYNYHCEIFHSDNGNSLVSIENANNDHTRYKSCEEYGSIVKDVPSLPDGLRNHMNFVALVGENLCCLLCNCELSSSSDKTVDCGKILQNHFLEFYHQSQYEVCVQKDINHIEDGQEFEKNNVSLKSLQFNRSTINQMGSPSTLFKNITLDQYCTDKRTVEVPDGKVRSRFEVQEILYRLVNELPLVNRNKHVLDEKEGHFHCGLCNEILRCTRSGSQLIKHLNEEGHLTKSKKGINSKIKGKARKRDKVLNILRELSSHNEVINQNNDFIEEKSGHFFCKLCDEVIMCTLSGKKLIDHLNGLLHGSKFTDAERELRSKARTPEHVYNILWQLSSNKSEVSENIEVLGEKQGHFYCEVCDEVLLCTCSGSKLIEHLRDKQHVFKFLEHTSNNLQ